MTTEFDEGVRRVEGQIQALKSGEDVEKQPAKEAKGSSRGERDQRRLVRSERSMARRLRSRHRPEEEAKEKGRRSEGRRA